MGGILGDDLSRDSQFPMNDSLYLHLPEGRPVAGKSPWGGPSPPNSPKSPLFVRVPPYLHTKIFSMGGAMAPLAPPSATGLPEGKQAVSVVIKANILLGKKQGSKKAAQRADRNDGF